MPPESGLRVRATAWDAAILHTLSRRREPPQLPIARAIAIVELDGHLAGLHLLLIRRCNHAAGRRQQPAERGILRLELRMRASVNGRE